MSFDFNTITNFDSHILQSIPNYDVLFNSLLRMSEFFKDDNKKIYDIGCSTGTLLKALQFDGLKVGLDNSDNLLPKSENGIEFINRDLNNSWCFRDACIIYSIFTLQFLRRESRARIIQDAYNGLCEGGAFFLAEKTYTDNAITQDIYTFSYYDFKKSNFTEKEILDKERDLRKILHPNKSSENIQMLKRTGFKTVEMFYKYFQFEGWLCIK